jgi:ubiquitin C-terminal hydrolase
MAMPPPTSSSWASVVKPSKDGGYDCHIDTNQSINCNECVKTEDRGVAKAEKHASKQGHGRKQRQLKEGYRRPPKQSENNIRSPKKKTSCALSGDSVKESVGSPKKQPVVFGEPPPHAWKTASETRERLKVMANGHNESNIVSEEDMIDHCDQHLEQLHLHQEDADPAALSTDTATSPTTSTSASPRFEQDVRFVEKGNDLSFSEDKEEEEKKALAMLAHLSLENIAEMGTVHLVPKGIQNPGNVCFANSVIQALLGVQAFCNVFYAIKCAGNAIDDGFPVLKSISRIANEFRFDGSDEEKVVTPSRRGKRQSMYVVPRTVSVSLITDLIHESFNTRYKGEERKRQIEQEDAHEFLHCLLDAIHKEMTRLQEQKMSVGENQQSAEMEDTEDGWLTQTGKRAVKQQVVRSDVVQKGTIITDLFEGMQSTSISSRGNPPSVTMHPFLVVEIPLYDPSISTIEEALDSLTATETISGYRPRGQEGTCDANKSERFQSLPDILVFHLMRFQFSGATEKLNKRIAYNKVLRIRNSWITTNSKDRHAEYELVSTIAHHGQSIARGHFTANVRYRDQWLNFNDETILKIKEEHVYRDVPYLLVYNRKRKL